MPRGSSPVHRRGGLRVQPLGVAAAVAMLGALVAPASAGAVPGSGSVTGSGSAAGARSAAARALPAAPSDGPGKPGGVLTVMTWNVYIGNPPSPVLNVTRTRYPGYPRIMVSSDFPTRAVRIAAAIKAHQPDLVGLQEVSNWAFARTSPGPELAGIKFLPVLRAALAAQGLDYAVAAIRENGAVGPFPYVDPARNCISKVRGSADCTVSVADRDVILVNRANPLLSLIGGSASDATFAGREPRRDEWAVKTYARGFAHVDLVFDRVPLRFATTHLVPGSYPRRQLSQARQLISSLKDGPPTAIVTGDFNSDAYGTGSRTYRFLATNYLRDAWDAKRDGLGLTCCQKDRLGNLESVHRIRIDAILFRGVIVSRRATTVDDTPSGVPPAPIWASDHAGVVTTLVVRAPEPPPRPQRPGRR